MRISEHTLALFVGPGALTDLPTFGYYTKQRNEGLPASGGRDACQAADR